MIYLLLATLCSSAIALILKFSESRDLNRMVVTAFNYVIASSVSLFFVLNGSLFSKSDPSISEFLSELPAVMQKGTFTDSSSFIWSVLTGIFAGILYFGGFIYIQKSISDNGVGITGAFSKIGIFIPMLLSIILWQEYPTSIQWAGISLAVCAMIIANYTPDSKNSFFTFKKSLILVFLVAGLAEFSNKFFQNYAVPEYKSLFLLTVFITAFFISITFVILEKKKFTKTDILTGLLVGIPNMFTSFFLISAFRYVKTTIALPVYSAGTIVVINLGGYLLFKEKPAKNELYSILIIIVAIILMSL